MLSERGALWRFGLNELRTRTMARFLAQNVLNSAHRISMDQRAATPEIAGPSLIRISIRDVTGRGCGTIRHWIFHEGHGQDDQTINHAPDWIDSNRREYSLSHGLVNGYDFLTVSPRHAAVGWGVGRVGAPQRVACQRQGSRRAMPASDDADDLRRARLLAGVPSSTSAGRELRCPSSKWSGAVSAAGRRHLVSHNHRNGGGQYTGQLGRAQGAETSCPFGRRNCDHHAMVWRSGTARSKCDPRKGYRNHSTWGKVRFGEPNDCRPLVKTVGGMEFPCLK